MVALGVARVGTARIGHAVVAGAGAVVASELLSVNFSNSTGVSLYSSSTSR